MIAMHSISAPLVLLCLWLTVARAVLDPRGKPANATGVQTITGPGGVTIRYKNPGSAGVCETTPGVNSYSGYVDLDASTHMFFYFAEARSDPGNAPLTLWLNGGPGSDSLIGLFQELGPCNVTRDLKTQLNPYAWNEVSNMLFLSQPIGVGFSYSYENGVTGTYSEISPEAIVSTTDQAAVATWHVLQAFLANLPKLDSKVNIMNFNLWTESYGGHYGPSFYSYFYEQNLAIANGSQTGVQLVMDTLGIINGIIDVGIQSPYYAEFAVNNTYGIKAISDSIYTKMKTAYTRPGGCRDLAAECADADVSTVQGQNICVMASNICYTETEKPYYTYSGRGVYDIRHPYNDPTPPEYFVSFLNLASTQNAFGVNINYTSESSDEVASYFGQTGDYAYGEYIKELESLLDLGIRVALFYGDADYICNWFGGEAVSLSVNYTHSDEFRASGYAPFVVDGVEYGEVRQYGNFSFTRIYEAGHEIPYYQPVASLEFFRRVLQKKVLSDGSVDVTGSYGTNGDACATHVESSGVPHCTGTATGTVSRSLIGTETTTATSTASGGTTTVGGTGVSPATSSSAANRRVKAFWM